MEKYYTPTIEEFHVGFEYEISNSESTWNKRTIRHGADIDEIRHNRIYPIRVKYLDQQDIEAEGWIKQYTSADGTEGFSVSGYKLEIKRTRVTIYPLNKTSMFVGEIRNRSELHRIMRQIGIKP